MLLMLRHGQTPKGMKDPDLTAEGLAGIMASVERLKQFPIQGIFVDTTERTRETAQLWSQSTGVPVQVFPQLENWKLGPDHEGKHSDATDKFVAQLIANPDLQPVGGEAAKQYWDRLMSVAGPIIDAPYLYGMANHSRGIKSVQIMANSGDIPNPETWEGTPLPKHGEAILVTKMGAVRV